MESDFCVNCGSAGGSMVLDNEQILHCVQQWTTPRLVEAHDLICTSCWTITQETIQMSTPSSVGRNCVLCSRTLDPRTWSHHLMSLKTNNTQHHINIRNIIVERLAPLEIHASYFICHPCWQRADRAARHYTAPSSSRATTTTSSNPLSCANCDINLIRECRHILNNENILMHVQQNVAPREVTANDYICGACHTLFLNRDPTVSSQDIPIVGHHHVCLGCGCSLARTGSHSLGAEINQHVLNVVQSWIEPREIWPSDSLCERCFRRAEIESSNSVLPESTVGPVPQQASERITLPNYCRASDTHRSCLFQGCSSTFQ